jgi:hypothetical protein
MALQQEMLWVERFEGSGYVTWQLSLRIALIERDLWRIVDGLEKKREATVLMVDRWANQHTILVDQRRGINESVSIVKRKRKKPPWKRSLPICNCL